MGYIDDSLSDKEEVKDRFNLHWFAKIPMFLWLTLAIPTLGFTLYSVFQEGEDWKYSLAIPVCVIALILAFVEWLKLRSIEQGVTNKRVINKKGFIRRESDEMKVASIETVEIIQSVFGRMFGYGTVRITGKGTSDLVFNNIDDPMDVKRKIESVEPLFAQSEAEADEKV